MAEAIESRELEPLRLEQGWRRGALEGATIHALRVVDGGDRSAETADRDALHRMVREIVREELRSDLGRRMTSVIRKLVRDEVSRVFSRLARS